MNSQQRVRRDGGFTTRSTDGSTASWRYRQRSRTPDDVLRAPRVWGPSLRTHSHTDPDAAHDFLRITTQFQPGSCSSPTDGPDGGGEETDTLLCRLQGRRMVQWMAAYMALAWFVLQVMDVLGEVWAWPLFAQKAICLALGVGVLPASVLAWYHGEKGRQRVCGMEVTLLAATLMGLVMVIWSVCFSTLPAAG